MPVRLVAVRSRLPLDRVGGLVCPARPVKAAPLGDVGVILAAAVDADRFPADVRAGIGAAEGLGRSWREARTALRFSTPRQPVVHYTGLGALALLAQVPEGVARENADVAAIARMADSPEDLGTLDAYCATGSLRRAADLLHLHHSSVARRLEQLGRSLGIELTEPTGPIRARLALAAWRLLDGLGEVVRKVRRPGARRGQHPAIQARNQIVRRPGPHRVPGRWDTPAVGGRAQNSKATS